MLTIRNIDKIFGRQLYSKWLPNSKGWAVSSVEAVGDTYIFELVSNGRFKQAEIQLRRQPIWDKVKLETVYEIWAWNLETNTPEILWKNINDIKTTDDMVLWLGYMIDKIVPKD